MTSNAPRISVSPARRYSVAAGRRWPVDVRPALGELLSSWLHRLAHANGVPPRYFGAVLGAAGEAWSAQLDRHLPEAVRRLLLDHTSICPEELDGLCLGPSQLSVLRLRLRTRPHDAATSTAQSAWLQYCPVCLRDDEVPYFRCSWTLATRVSCFHHGCRLRDRCPSCGQGLAPFKRDRLLPQQYCTFCDSHLAKPTALARAGARRLERLIDDLLRLDTAGRALGVGRGARKTLPARIAICPMPIGTTTSTIPHLSHRVSETGLLSEKGFKILPHVILHKFINDGLRQIQGSELFIEPSAACLRSLHPGDQIILCTNLFIRRRYVRRADPKRQRRCAGCIRQHLALADCHNSTSVKVHVVDIALPLLNVCHELIDGRSNTRSIAFDAQGPSVTPASEILRRMTTFGWCVPSKNHVIPLSMTLTNATVLSC